MELLDSFSLSAFPPISNIFQAHKWIGNHTLKTSGIINERCIGTLPNMQSIIYLSYNLSMHKIMSFILIRSNIRSFPIFFLKNIYCVRVEGLGVCVCVCMWAHGRLRSESHHFMDHLALDLFDTFIFGRQWITWNCNLFIGKENMFPYSSM